ncbi:hypothetical protein Kisp01_69810 [Kineosporia sp. NBRC 101677]|nr:hypothetical protein [Kineosporia sp. NBRC 101677]GLY19967.1 hypothetical protein Kisp01_69810 [Kineosporia sp. NBRC 101677]
MGTVPGDGPDRSVRSDDFETARAIAKQFFGDLTVTQTPLRHTVALMGSA